jgi:hypothetical protein
VNRLERIKPDGPEATIVSSICFDSFAAAFRHMTRGRVSVSSDLRPEQVTQQMVDAAPETVVVLGTDWNWPNYSTSSWSVNWEASSTCTPSLAWQVSYVGDSYNDKFSSAKSYGGCHNFHHYENGGYGGAVQTCSPNCQSFGIMDNQTSSLKWGY